MINENPVFITGLGAITASGLTVEENWQSIIQGQCHLNEIEEEDISQWPHRLGGEIKNFKAAKMLPDRKLIKVISKQDALGIYAAIQAVEDSGMIDWRDNSEDTRLFNDKTAVFVGSPGNKYYQQYDFLPLIAKSGDDMQHFAKDLFSEVHPMWLLRILPNNVLAYTGIQYGFKGPNHNITNHAVSGAQALLEATYAIKSGQAERAVVVAYDIALEAQALYYYDKLGVISGDGLRPFDASHNGTILGNAAAAIVLESEASAKARSANCYAECLGGLSETEGNGLFGIEEEGQQLSDMLQRTLERCQLKAEDIDLIVPHANGNPKSDDSEAMAIHRHFSNKTAITGFKWSMGHSLAASGLVDAVLTVCALKEKTIPGIPNFKNAATAAKDLNISVSAQTLKANAHALLINRGFGSMNAAMVLKACE
jgi:3-oxoacyl-[acyl-carrier-protein] synthase-1